MAVCKTVTKKNFGRSKCNSLPTMPIGMITMDDDVVIPKATVDDEALLLAFFNEKILAKKAWYWPYFSSYENINQETTYQDTAHAYHAVNDGNYRFRFGISENICLHKAMYTHRAVSGQFILVMKGGFLLLTELTNGDAKGMSVQLLHTEKFRFNDGTVVTESPIVVALRDNIEIDENGIVVPMKALNELYRIVDVQLEIISAVDDEIVVEAKNECDGTPVLGLLLADFVFTDEAGVTQVISSSTPDGAGSYTLAGTGFNDGTLTLRSPATLTVKAYEGLESDVTIAT